MQLEKETDLHMMQASFHDILTDGCCDLYWCLPHVHFTHKSLGYGAVNGSSPYLRMGVVTWTGAFPMSILHTKALGMVQSMVVLHTYGWVL